MSLRYLAICGEASARADHARRAGLDARGSLVRRFDSASLELWAEPGAPVLPSRDGRLCLVGFAYDRDRGQPLSLLPSWAASAQAVLRDCWGAYVLFAGLADGHSALRDPSGSLPAYHRRDGVCHVYGSDEELLLSGATAPPSPDLEFVRHWLSFPYLRGARTGCIGIQEILPGQCRTVASGGIVDRQAWSPAAWAGRDAILDFDEAASLLREELLRCIPRMVPETGRAVLKLSGGLDSSLIATALATAERDFAAINFATRNPDGDERGYAREVAAACGIKMVELDEEPWAIGLEAAPRSRLRPLRHPMLQCLDRAYAARWRAMDADWIVDGAGGDNLFAYLSTAAPVFDAWACHGALAAIRAIADLTGIHGGTFWSAAGFAWRKARRGTTTRWPANHEFLRPEAVLCEPDPHPWLALPERARPGAREHVRSIVAVHSFLADPSPGSPAKLHPLLAQPILELCLRVPTHLWNRGGRDRAVARAAFAELLPEAIRERRHKSALGGMFRTQFRAIVPELSAFLRKGNLVEAGIIDAGAIANYLESPNLWAGYNTTRLLEIAAAEQWLRSFD